MDESQDKRTGATVGNVRRATARSRVLALYRRSDPRDLRWYFEQRDLLGARAGDLGIGTREFAGIVAALSPSKSWDTGSGATPNLDCAVRFVSTGANVHTGDCMRKARAILAGADPADVLHGPKERAFADNLADPEGSMEVTCDRWMARAIGKRSESFTPRQYQETADLFRSIARTLGIRPHELQACVWAQIRREWADER